MKNASKKRLTFDFETASECNLKIEGGFKYSKHPTTRATCLAFKIHDEPTVYFLDYYAINKPWCDQDPRLKKLWLRLISEEYEFNGHNVMFDRAIYTHVLHERLGWPKIPPRLYRCTAAKAAACAIPRNLEGAGEAMRLKVQKDKRGHAAVMLTCKPTKQYNAWIKARAEIAAGKKVGKRKQNIAAGPEPQKFITPESHPEVFQTLYTYCKIDVRAEEALDKSLPDLIPQEQEIWFLNQMLNWRGLRIDIPTVKKIVDIISHENKKGLIELDWLTIGLVKSPGARQSILDFLELDGTVLENLRAKTVNDKLEGFELAEDNRRLLELRKALSLTSTKKYLTMLNRADENDHRVRDILMYHGASTGRDTGTGLQPHNFPRGIIKVDKDDPYEHVENVANLDHDMLSLIYGNDSLSMVFSSILRNMIMPSEGCELFVADFSKIEVAVLWWLADNEAGLDVLRSGKDPYKYMASANTGRAYEKISDEGPERQLGKAQVLGCGFGMGAAKFQTTAWDMYRVKLTLDESKKAVYSYRSANAAVPVLWRAYENAAIKAVEKKGSVQKAGKCDFIFERNFLWIKLPSGRKLAYKDPQISWRETEYGSQKTLEFYGIYKQRLFKLERTWGGTLAENITQAVARDLMMPAMVRLEKRGYKALLAVHDEALTEIEIGKGDLNEFTKIMCEAPPWGQGLPIEAKGWQGPRYRK